MGEAVVGSPLEQNPSLLNPVYRILCWARASLGLRKNGSLPESECLKKGHNPRSQR